MSYRIRLQRDSTTFVIIDKATEAIVEPVTISSGESELISIGIECLAFKWDCRNTITNVLFIDEPDVHLHPDLQSRFASFLLGLSTEANFRVVIATHSTSMVSALANDPETSIAFLNGRDTDVIFTPIRDSLRRVLPMFGAHPLSNVYSQSPILLVEGSDDERIWQQVVRSSQGAVRLHPCGVEGIHELAAHETEASELLAVVYDNAVGYSLRDLDNGGSDIADTGRIHRMKLNCRAAENLILTDDVLASQGHSWEQMQEKIAAWIQANPQHQNLNTMSEFANGFDRRMFDLKNVRNDLVSIMGSRKQWEVLVGQAIAAFRADPTEGPNSIRDYLGVRSCELLLGIPAG